MKVSIFTAVTDPRYLEEAYESIREQDFAEWVLAARQDVALPKFKDKRVKVAAPPAGADKPSALKNAACARCRGDIVLELGQDDLLAEGAVDRVRREFEADPECGFVYSGAAYFQDGFVPAAPHDALLGWRYRDFEYRGKKLQECVAPAPYPSNASTLWFAPNHLRAWRRDLFRSLGGYRDDLQADLLYEQELLARTFVAAKMNRIDACLYLCRIANDKFYLRYDGGIQQQAHRIYAETILPMTAAWAKRNGLRAVDLGGRFNGNALLESVDLKDADVCTDLNERWPFADGSVGLIVANDIFEHLSSPLHVMKEVYRVLCHGGILLSSTPSTEGKGAFQDPTHVSFWNDNSFWYYTRAETAKYIDTPVRFQKIVVDTLFYSDWHRANGLPYVRAHLVALKDGGERIHGVLEI